MAADGGSLLARVNKDHRPSTASQFNFAGDDFFIQTPNKMGAREDVATTITSAPRTASCRRRCRAQTKLRGTRLGMARTPDARFTKMSNETQRMEVTARLHARSEKRQRG